ncbi:MAG TPA: multiprotein-bridging factor 1 family protein [Verrucomicrobiae bacterium]|nr:multiprotein-bridging factor 1 family protein [Verrucomicrobiae bacterium]
MVSFCEVCGKQIEDRTKVMIENTVFNVCITCSKRGKPIEAKSGFTSFNKKNNEGIKKLTSKYSSTTKPLTNTTTKPSSRYNKIKTIPKNKPPPQKKINLTDEFILDPEFPKVIRDARNKKGITHDQLGQKINEKVTLLKKIETGTIKPDETLSKKLEKFLGIKLYINLNEESIE